MRQPFGSKVTPSPCGPGRAGRPAEDREGAADEPFDGRAGGAGASAAVSGASAERTRRGIRRERIEASGVHHRSANDITGRDRDCASGLPGDARGPSAQGATAPAERRRGPAYLEPALGNAGQPVPVERTTVAATRSAGRLVPPKSWISSS